MNTVAKQVTPFLEGFPESKTGELIDFIQFLKNRYDSQWEEDEEISTELEKELLRLSKEAKEDIAAGKYKTYEEHVKWVESLELDQ